MLNDFRGKAVLITGGTRGIGLATGLKFAEFGAHCILTHRWGSADENEIVEQFEALNAPAPTIVEADVANDEDTENLLKLVKEKHEGIHVFISNAAVAPLVNDMNDYVKRDFLRCIEYSTWPTAGYTKKINEVFGNYPRYIIAISSTGHLRYNGAYDAVALAKSSLETMCRYLAHRLASEGVSVNVIRPSFVDTEAFSIVVGEEFASILKKVAPDAMISPETVANAVLAFCSGLLDGVNGQVLQIDQGTVFSDTAVKHFESGVLK